MMSGWGYRLKVKQNDFDASFLLDIFVASSVTVARREKYDTNLILGGGLFAEPWLPSAILRL